MVLSKARSNGLPQLLSRGGWLWELGTSSIGHVNHGKADFMVVMLTAALGGHGVFAFER